MDIREEMDSDETTATEALCLHNFIEVKNAEIVICNICMESIPNNPLIIKYHVFTTSHMSQLIVNLNSKYAQGIAIPRLMQDMRYFRIHKIIYINDKSIYCFVCSVKANVPKSCNENSFTAAADEHIHNSPKHAKYMYDMLNDLCDRGALQCLGVLPQANTPIATLRDPCSYIPVPIPLMPIGPRQLMPMQQPSTAIFQVPSVPTQPLPNMIYRMPSSPMQPPPNIFRPVATIPSPYQGSPLYTEVQTVKKRSPPPQQTEASEKITMQPPPNMIFGAPSTPTAAMSSSYQGNPLHTDAKNDKNHSPPPQQTKASENITDPIRSDYELMMSKFNFDIKNGDDLNSDFTEMLSRNSIHSYMRSESQKYCNVCNLIVDIDELKSHLLSDEHYAHVKHFFNVSKKENEDRTLGEIFNIDPAKLKETANKVNIANSRKELFKLLDDYWCEVISNVGNEIDIIFEKSRQLALQNYGLASPALENFVSRLGILYSMWLQKNGGDNAELNANDDLYIDIQEEINTSLKESKNVNLEPSVEDFFQAVYISPSKANLKLLQPEHPKLNTVPIVKPSPIVKPTPIGKPIPIAKPAPITECAAIAKTNTSQNEPKNVNLERSVGDFFKGVYISPFNANLQLLQPEHPKVNTVPIVKPTPIAKPMPIAESTPIAKPAPTTEPAAIAKTNITLSSNVLEIGEELAALFNRHRIESIGNNKFECHICSVKIDSISNTIGHISGKKHVSNLHSPNSIKSSTPSDDSDCTYEVNAHLKNKIQCSDKVMRFINPAKVTTEPRKSQTNEQNIQTVDNWRKPFNEEAQFQVKPTPYQGAIKRTSTPSANERTNPSQKSNSGNNSPLPKVASGEQKKRSTLFQTHYIYPEGEMFRCKLCDQSLSSVSVVVDHIITVKHRANLQTMED